MELTFINFWQEVVRNPVLFITVVLTLGVIFVNGWTDAPNAIATCVATRCMPVRAAILMSAGFNFLGVFVMTQINSSVASTISNMVDFGEHTDEALIALCAALLSIVIYSTAASFFGIPTSESHSLIAGLSGAAIAIQQGVGGINFDEWVKVLYGSESDSGICNRMGCVQDNYSCVPEYGQTEDKPLFWRRPDCRSSGYELYAWSPGRTEVYRCFVFGNCLFGRTYIRKRYGNSGMADACMQCCYGCGNQCRR